ncbi:hypothetical protein HK102_001246 [Quaeritorhiza haematococci]|nr:hypothetical protein HK102_001246 [Quaeritorhiza haematococci]
MKTVPVLSAFAAIAVGCAFAAPKSDDVKCPPSQFRTVDNLDVDAFMGRWYVQKQSEAPFVDKTRNFCNYAQYTRVKTDKIDVFNYGNEAKVNGKVVSAKLVGRVPNLNEPSKLKVGQSWIPFGTTFYAPLWVVATGDLVPAPPQQNQQNQQQQQQQQQQDVKLQHTQQQSTQSSPSQLQYEWAILSAGEPRSQSNGKCAANGFGVLTDQGRGLWLFTRSPTVDPSVVEKMVQKAEELGLDTSILNPVTQEGCEYKLE